MAEEFYNETDDFEVRPKMPEDKEALDRYYKFIGERLRNAREQSGCTLANLAKGIGLTSSAVSNYESGIRQIPVHILQEFARVLGKPLHYFLGPGVEDPSLIQATLKTAIERFSDAFFIEVLYEIKDGNVSPIEELFSLIPVPVDIGKDHHFAIREFNESEGTLNYYVCKWYKPETVIRVIPLLWRKTSQNLTPPKPEDWVIAERGDTEMLELVQFKNVSPSKTFDKTESFTINIRAIVISKLERLVK
ncbi:MAG: helix-turn-helix transcriptional regulator [Bacillota bacterium]